MKDFVVGDWKIGYSELDGGRIDYIAYHGKNIISDRNDDYKPPVNDWGRFETRPVHGFDDCFPSVVKGDCPGVGRVPDHGELCWLPWKTEVSHKELTFSVHSEILPILFIRKLQFYPNKLVWKYEIKNLSLNAVPFLHVVHPLLPLKKIVDFDIPDFNKAFEVHENEGELKINSKGLKTRIMELPNDEARMYFLHDLKEGEVAWKYDDGIKIVMKFPVEIFPNLGIWWDRGGYPREEGSERYECAFEPVAAPSSNLKEAIHNKTAQILNGQESLCWEMEWEIQ